MRALALLLLPAAASCFTTSFQPRTVERRGIDEMQVGMVTAQFEVSCQDCRIEYGREESTYRDRSQGGWSGSVPLGFIQDDQRVRVVLRVVPAPDAVVVSALIVVNGRTLGSAKSKKAGEPVYVRASVGRGG